jgi:hypothetical protein
MTEKAPISHAQIRRFDIFAEWNRLKARNRHHMSASDARAYGLAVAKVVAARKLHGAAPDQASDLKRRARNDDVSEPWWEHLGSDNEFEQKIVRRMGQTFYRDVFQPAVQRAWDAEKSYEDIRDTLRAEWNAQRDTSSARSQARAPKAGKSA